MKKIFLLIPIIALSCNKSIDEINKKFPLLTPVKADANAGTWKPILVSNFDSYTPSTPLNEQDPGFKQQLNDIVELQKSMNDADMQNMKYWGAGGILRWNEILRELVAKYNLPPVNNADGTYPIPIASNPLAYPYFPFANPPYAARAYAYVSAAQYDALVTAFYFKSKCGYFLSASKYFAWQKIRHD